jgi:ABC-type bacteriocin/lantibiotic exporter with double-glycine peptidase domain
LDLKQEIQIQIQIKLTTVKGAPWQELNAHILHLKRTVPEALRYKALNLSGFLNTRTRFLTVFLTVFFTVFLINVLTVLTVMITKTHTNAVAIDQVTQNVTTLIQCDQKYSSTCD